MKKILILYAAYGGGHLSAAQSLINYNDKNYQNVDFVGYTCLEQDVIYSGYNGNLGIGDIVEIYNVGGYSIVDKPPFIHPDIPSYMLLNDNVSCIKREQTLEDIFAPYEFVAVEAQ